MKYNKNKTQLIKMLKSRIVENGLAYIKGNFKVYINVYGRFKKEDLILSRTGIKRHPNRKEIKYENFLKRTIREMHDYLDSQDLF